MAVAPTGWYKPAGASLPAGAAAVRLSFRSSGCRREELQSARRPSLQSALGVAVLCVLLRAYQIKRACVCV
jgi:hypothetical protein